MIDYRKLYSNYDKEDLVNTCVNLKQYKENLRKEVNKSYIVCNEKDKEIERLNTNYEVAIEDLTKIAQLLDLEAGCTIYDIEDKIKELKGSESNE